MYIYQITNLINGKIYIGQTNNIEKRWGAHRRCRDSSMAIARAIKKYGADNFKFEVLYRNIPIDQIDELEIKTISEKNSQVPNGYNITAGGSGLRGVHKYGADNSNAHLSQEEAQYVLDHRDQPIYVLYDAFSDKISYNAFKKIYHHKTYKNLETSTPEYPHNFEFSNQFTSGGKLEYDEVVDLRKRYANGEYWQDVYEDYKWLYSDKWTFWNIYYGNRYQLVMPEVFTPENRKKHSSMKNQGAANGRAKLTENDVLAIRKLHNQGVTNSELYELYPQVSETSIRNIINNKTWKNLL